MQTLALSRVNRWPQCMGFSREWPERTHLHTISRVRAMLVCGVSPQPEERRLAPYATDQRGGAQRRCSRAGARAPVLARRRTTAYTQVLHSSSL